jgi:tetratricopeptide (TPR) repeat protein
VWLHDRTFFSGSFRAALRRRPWLYGGLAATWGLLAWLLARLAAVPEPTAGFALRGVSPLAYALTQPGVILHYLRLAAWPAGLTLDYGWPLARTPREVLGPTLVVGALLMAAAWALRRRPALGFVGAWFFLTLAPSSSVIPVADAAFEHRMYLPLAAPIVLAVLGGRWVLRRGPPRQRLLGPALVLAAAAALGAATIRRNEVYRSPVRLWSDVVAKRPQNSRGHTNLGYALAQAGRAAEAIAAYERALALDPSNPEAHNNLGEALGRLGRLDEAVAHLDEAVRLKPGYAEAYNNLGNAAAVAGDLDAALSHYRRALRLRPGYAQAHNNLAVALTRRGAWDEALRHFDEALRLDPGYATAQDNVAHLFARRVAGR